MEIIKYKGFDIEILEKHELLQAVREISKNLNKESLRIAIRGLSNLAKKEKKVDR